MSASLKAFPFFITFFLQILSPVFVYSQSPYSLPPKWYFGRQAGIDFTSGSPVTLSGGKVDGTGQEASTTMCDTAGNVLFYSDSYRLYDGTNTFVQFVNGGTSSSNSSICFPDPTSPKDQFYFITANEDLGGGGEQGATVGIYYYLVQKTGPGTITILSGPTLLASNGEVTEQLCSGSDGNGGYWVVAHQGGGANGNQIWSWNFPVTGGVGAKQISSVAGTENNNTFQGSLKINRCQNLLAAVFWTGKVEVYNWDKSTGKVTSLYRSYALPSLFAYGCEFSPDGNMLYFTSLVGNQLYQYDLVANSVTALAGGSSSNNIAEMGTLQLGPDDKIYVTNVSNYATPAYIGVINDPDVAGAGCNYNSTGYILNDGSSGFTPNIYRGIANEPWVNPTLDIDTTGACLSLGFSYDFMTYFLPQDIAVAAGTEEWDFGDGAGFQAGLGATPSHTFAAAGNYTVKLKLTDATCGHTWQSSRTITVNSCTTTPPSTQCNDLKAEIISIPEIELDGVNPSVATFIGDSSEFDLSVTDPQKFYWMVGLTDTSQAFSTNATASLSFAYKGQGGFLPQGHYTIFLVISQGSCLDTASFELDVTHIYIPNLVTPNADKFNDKFEITNTTGRFDVEIFNRWGDKVYEEKGYTNGWPGSKVSDGVYFFYLTDSKKDKHYKGWVEVLH